MKKALTAYEPTESDVEPSELAEFVRYWRKIKGVSIHNGNEKGILARTHWPILEMPNGMLYTIGVKGNQAEAIAYFQKRFAPVQAVLPGTQLRLF